MKNYINQYKVVFCLSWTALFLIFPVWISKHLLFQSLGFSNLNYSFARALIIFGMITFFSISAYLMDRIFKDIIVDKPVMAFNDDWLKLVKKNSWLVAICCLSLVLHIYTFSPLIVLCEVRSLHQTFWMYDAINNYWQGLFGFPLQYFFWSTVFIIILLIKQKKVIGFISNYISEKYSVFKSNNPMILLFVFFIFGLFNIYADFFPYYSWQEATQIIRYPPVSRFIYMTTYAAFGTSHTVPQIVQLVFYMLSAIYLYRVICLFHEKETALLGATIYLFSPIVFLYATIANLVSGTVCFIILISYYFLKFTKEEDNRDLILASFFLGIGFMYKRVVLLMFIICFIYLVFIKIKTRNWNSFIHFKILLLSLVTIVPWLKLGKVHSFPFVWSHLKSFDGLSIIPLMLHSQISGIVFILFVFSIIILIAKRNDLSLFFGLLITIYYLLFTLMSAGEFNHRYLMVIYPAVAVFLAQIISTISQKIRWKYTFKLLSIILSVYLIASCVMPRSSFSFITFKYRDFESQYYPIDRVIDFIKNSAEKKENILALYMIPYKFYIDEIYADRHKIGQKKFIFRDPGSEAKEIVYPLENLKKFCNKEKIDYIIFPYGPNNMLPNAGPFNELMEMTKYLKENMDNDFTQVAKFNIDDNYIYIYKLTERH